MHSKLIEHYQYVEKWLEYIYASLREKHLYEGLEEVEKSNSTEILKRISKIEHDKSITVFTEQQYTEIKTLIERRNFWTHECYVDMVFDRKTDAPKKESDIAKLYMDIEEASRVREWLFQKQYEMVSTVKAPGGFR